jgi:hypothetical protein
LRFHPVGSKLQLFFFAGRGALLHWQDSRQLDTDVVQAENRRDLQRKKTGLLISVEH